MAISLPLPSVPFRIRIGPTVDAIDNTLFERDDKTYLPKDGTVTAVNLGHLRVTWDCAPDHPRWVDRDFVHLI